MEDIGLELRATREQLGLTLDEVERATRIRTHHLQALERGELDALPSPVQARGFLRNYADFLGLDADAILLRYAEVLQARRSRPRVARRPSDPGTRPSVQVRSRRPRWLSADLFVASGITLAILVVMVWGVGRVMAGLREQTQASLEVSGFLVSTLTPTVSETAALTTITPAAVAEEALEPAQSPTQPILVAPANVIDIRIVVERRAWVRVTVDGVERFRGRVAPGQVLEVQGEEAVEVATGNGGGLRIFHNGRDQGMLGELGQVVIRIWTREGVLTPTATQTRTPTATPRTTATPTPTPVPPSTPES